MSFVKAFQKQKQLKKKGKIDAITNQNKRLETLTNKGDHKSIYKEIFDKLVKWKFDKIKELSDEINHTDLIYYFKNNTTTKYFIDFENEVELFRKIKCGEVELEDVKELLNIFETNLNKISKGRFKPEEEESVSENIKLLYKSQQVALNCLKNILQLHLKLNAK